MKATAITTVLVTALAAGGCGDAGQARQADGGPEGPSSRPALRSDLMALWRGPEGQTPLTRMSIQGSPMAGSDLQIAIGEDGAGPVRHLAAQHSEGRITLDGRGRCRTFKADIDGRELSLTAARAGCPSTRASRMLTSQSWTRLPDEPRVPKALAGTWRATIADRLTESEWTLEFNQTGGRRNGPSMVIDSAAAGTIVQPVEVGGDQIRILGLRGPLRTVCSTYAYVVAGDRLVLASQLASRCRRTPLHDALSRGWWERSR